MRFFDQFRQNVARFAKGVHELGGVPSVEALAEADARLGWAKSVRAFYESFDGARLFADSFVLLPVAELVRIDDSLRLGTALELELRVDRDGRIRELDESGDAIVVGTSIERWLDALMARERLVVDREGEFKDVFSDDGQELLPAVRARRIKAGQKNDPGAAQFWLEGAELALEEGDVEGARQALREAIALDGEAPALQGMLAGVLLEAGEIPTALTHYLAAAERSASGEVRARRFAQAAALASRSNDEVTRAAAAASALAAAGDAPGKWLAEAETAFTDGDFDTAQHLAGLAQAVAASSAGEALLRRLTVRRSLKVIS